MNRSPSKTDIALHVKAADRLTEIFLIDSRFERVASAVGSLEVKVGPGLYKARFRCGQTQIDSLIEVEAGIQRKAFVGPKVPFATPAPLPDTSTWRQGHETAARELSRQAGIRRGRGSGLFLCCRALADASSQPWAGVSLHDLNGGLIAPLDQGLCDAAQGFSALTLEVDPGTYRLRVEEEAGELYEMFVVTLPGWQTQVFTLAENAWLPGIEACRAALPTASVLMAAMCQGFEPTAAVARQTELLRLGLLHGRKVLTKTGAQRLLAGQPNPMIAVFVLHLLLGQEEGLSVAETWAAHVEDRLIAHPDLRAALLPLTKTGEMSIFASPPMLRSSWQLIIEALGKDRAEIPAGSVNDQLKRGALNTALWLMQRPV